jgi:hypothetical protein
MPSLTFASKLRISKKASFEINIKGGITNACPSGGFDVFLLLGGKDTGWE